VYLTMKMDDFFRLEASEARVVDGNSDRVTLRAAVFLGLQPRADRARLELELTASPPAS
jgi:hypothetical protein